MIIQGDCLQEMLSIPDGSIDLVLTDPPYGTMNGAGLDGWDNNKTIWDKAIDPALLWDILNKKVRLNGTVVLFSQEPYTSKLIVGAHGNLPFAYRMIWKKDHFANALVAKVAPVSYYEDIVVFFKKYDTLEQHPLREYTKTLFSFIGKTKKELFNIMGHQGVCHFMRTDSMQFSLCTEKTYNELIELFQIDTQSWFLPYSNLEDINRRFNRRFNLPDGKKYLSNVLEFKKDYMGLHPTQKPVALMERIIETYTDEGETVLDFTMGSGTTGVACVNLNRKFIGIELDHAYFETAKNRIAEKAQQICLTL